VIEHHLDDGARDTPTAGPRKIIAGAGITDATAGRFAKHFSGEAVLLMVVAAEGREDIDPELIRIARRSNRNRNRPPDGHTEAHLDMMAARFAPRIAVHEMLDARRARRAVLREMIDTTRSMAEAEASLRADIVEAISENYSVEEIVLAWGVSEHFVKTLRHDPSARPARYSKPGRPRRATVPRKMRPAPTGPRNRRSPLTPALVAEVEAFIRGFPDESDRAIAEALGICRASVSRIRQGVHPHQLARSA